MQAADLYCARVGDAAVAPADKTVVVPDVTAEIVQVPAPLLRTVITVPTGKATDAFVGILNAIAVALFTKTAILAIVTPVIQEPVTIHPFKIWLIVKQTRTVSVFAIDLKCDSSYVILHISYCSFERRKFVCYRQDLSSYSMYS